MKRLLLFQLIFISALSVTAQKEAWKWYFGYQAAVDFSSGSPVPLTDSQMSQWEGCSSISDHDGNLLFYTDGLSVWNKNHTIMPNGSGMLGDPSSTQSSLVVPKPGSDSLYYIFVTSGTNAHYSELDITLDGGLGDITANKNILVSSNSAEKLAGVFASNGTDIWVAIHENSDATFLAYKVSNTGVDLTPVTSIVGNTLIGNIGQLQFSPDGTRAAMASYSSINNQTIEVFDFDASTGEFSNQIGLPTSYFQTYGLEFSPSGKLLYTGADPDVSEVHQWNLDAGSVADIIASNTVVGTTLGVNGSLQLGPDGKIYMVSENSTYLQVINDPDSLGLACNWDPYGVNLSPKTVGLGLPNFLSSYFEEPQNIVAFTSTDTSLCKKFCISFTDNSQNDPVSWLWTFEGGSPPTSTDQNPANICYNLPGTYDVKLVTTNASGHSDSLTLNDYITVFDTPPFPTITQTDYTLIASAAISYQWQLNSVDIPGATNQVYDVMQTGFYTVVVTDANGCYNSTTLYVEIVGIDEISSDLNFDVFPNPSTGILNFEFADASTEKMTLRIFNALGQTVYSSQDVSKQKDLQIDLSNVTSGVYTIQLKTEHGIANKKINILHQ